MKRKCSVCKEDKELNDDNFYRDSRLSENFNSACKLCCRKRVEKANEKRKAANSWMRNVIG